MLMAMNNEIDLDLSDPTIAEAFAGNKVGDECTLENVDLKVRRISMSHDPEYGDDGKPTGEKKASGSITFEIEKFSYGDHDYDLTGGTDEKDSGGGEMGPSPAAAPIKEPKGSKSGLAVVIGIGKKK